MVRWMCVFLAVKFHPKDIQSTGRKKNEKYTINANFVYQYEKNNKNGEQTINNADGKWGRYDEIFYWIMKNCIYKLIIWWWFGERRSFLAW